MGTRITIIAFFFVIAFSSVSGQSLKSESNKKVIAFYNGGENDMGHKSFVREANRWFSLLAEKYKFTYDSTKDWRNLNSGFLSKYGVVIFLDSRPDSIPQREAFERYMKSGGGFMGFHFSAFALTPSAFPQNWDWYHNTFIGAGQYKGNTWRPTSAVLRVEDRNHPATRNLPATFVSSPNEWYSWQNDLRLNKDIRILLSIDTSSYPLGTGPKLYEIWHSGYYPVVWTNTKYRMLYINMGHNDIDYEGKSNKDLSHTFGNENQDQLITDGLLWLLKKH
jgi:hypothetical protein